MKEDIVRLESAMQQFDAVELPIKHYFANGMYAREMFVPAGVILTGAVHKTTHFCILSQGRVHVATGDEVLELVAPATLVAHPGAKRAIYALEDSVWTNIHATTETDLDRLAEELTESTAAELQGGASNPQQLASAARKQLETS